MRKLIVSFLVFSGPAFASLQCNVSQNSIAGNGSKTFTLESGRTERVDLGSRAVIVEQDKRSSTFRVVQHFLGEKDQYLEHQMTCDVNLNCSGARVLKYPKKDGKTAFKISADGGGVTALSGERPVMRFSNRGVGFTYQLLEGTGSQGEVYGIKVTCE